MPYKIFQVNEVLTAADVNDYLMEQAVMTFAGTAARATAIGTPVEGMVSYVGGGTVEVYAGTATGWTTISGGGGGGGVTIGTAAPSSPADGDLWWDSDDGKLFVYYDDGSSQQWVDAAGPSVAVQDTAPTGYEGQLWLDSTDGSMYTYYTDPGGTASSWIGAVSRSGGILQVVQGIKTATQTGSLATGATTTVTDLTASITPRSTSSKILVTVDINGSSSDGNGFSLILERDGTPISLGDASSSHSRITAGGVARVAGRSLLGTSFTVLDSPSTTSSITYTLDILNTNSGTVPHYINRTEVDTDSAIGPRAASRITLMEVAG